MKLQNVLSILFVYSILLTQLNAQCNHDHRSGWEKHLTQSTYKYYINWTNCEFSAFVGSSIAEKKQNIYQAVDAAFSAWGGPTQISFDSTLTESQRDIEIVFWPGAIQGGRQQQIRM